MLLFMKQWDNDFQKDWNQLNVDSKCFQMKINYGDYVTEAEMIWIYFIHDLYAYFMMQNINEISNL